MNRFLENQEVIKKCLSINSSFINEDTQHVLYLNITIRSNRFFYETNSIIIILDNSRREKEV